MPDTGAEAGLAVAAQEQLIDAILSESVQQVVTEDAASRQIQRISRGLLVRRSEAERLAVFENLLTEVLPELTKNAAKTVRSQAMWDERRESQNALRAEVAANSARWATTRTPVAEPAPSVVAGPEQGPIDLRGRRLEIDSSIWSPELERFESQPNPPAPPAKEVVRILRTTPARKPWSTWTAEMRRDTINVIKDLEQNLPGAVATLRRGEGSSTDIFEAVTGSSTLPVVTMEMSSWLKNALTGIYNNVVPRRIIDVAGAFNMGNAQKPLNDAMKAARDLTESELDDFMLEISQVRRQLEDEIRHATF